MLKNTRVLAAAFIGLGVLLGYAAAAGKLNPADWARAAQPAPDAKTDSVAVEGVKPGRYEGVSKGELVVLLNHNARAAAQAEKSGKKPNILVIWGDDIGQSNISAYSHGVMGYKTPNIDRIAREGMM